MFKFTNLTDFLSTISHHMSSLTKVMKKDWTEMKRCYANFKRSIIDNIDQFICASYNIYPNNTYKQHPQHCGGLPSSLVFMGHSYH